MNERSMSVTMAARNFADVIGRAHYRHEETLLLKNGEPVARIIPVIPDTCSAHDLLESWSNIPHLSPKDAVAFAVELTEAKKGLISPTASSLWD